MDQPQPPLRTFALGEAKRKKQEGTLPGKERPNDLPRTDLFLSKTDYWHKAVTPNTESGKT